MSGFICRINNNQEDHCNEQRFKQMAAMIAHRGCKGANYYFDDNIQLAQIKAHNCPQDEVNTFENERYVIVFNGAIYNRTQLKEFLTKEGLTIENNCDAQLIIALYSHIKERLVNKLQGMFAFIIIDKQMETVFGARDHFGMKPLFYFHNEKETIFASEKKCITYGLQNITVNHDALQHYLTYQYVPEPLTMSEQIKKVEPGCYFTMKFGGNISIEKYWQVSFQPATKEEDELIKAVRQAMITSVEKHLQYDGEIGTFLSGGIDSSFIAAIAKQFHPNIKTFSAGFERSGFSEIDVAKMTAEKLNVENISYVITPEQYMAELPKIIWHLDDPLADPACVPLYFVAREARKYVTATLSGEGADELFGGYNIYREPQSLAIFERIPNLFKKILRALAQILPEGMKGKSFLERGCTPLEQRYIGNAKMFTEAEKRQLLVNYNDEIPFTEITKALYDKCQNYNPVEKMQYIDIHTWLRGDILLKADKVTMAHNLEVRSPFLDIDVFNIAQQVPTNLKISHGTTKYILRKAAEGIVPDHVLYRKKLGFPVPIRHWLKDEMYEWAKKTINESNIDQFIEKSYVLNLLEKHCLNKGDYSRKIWTVLMFCTWHAVYIEQATPYYNFAQQPSVQKI